MKYIPGYRFVVGAVKQTNYPLKGGSLLQKTQMGKSKRNIDYGEFKFGHQYTIQNIKTKPKNFVYTFKDSNNEKQITLPFDSTESADQLIERLSA